jgi:chromosome partitioning protein
VALATHQRHNNTNTKRIAIAQRKGGVGKTTIAVSLAAEIRNRGGDVILIDADPLRSACEWAALGGLHFPIQEITFTTKGPVADWVIAVKRIRSDFVIVDTPPSEDALAASIALANVTIIPCLPSGLDLAATNRTLEIVNAVRGMRGDDVHVILTPNRVDRRTLEGRQLVDELEEYGEIVAPPIGNRSAFVRAFSLGNSVGDLDPYGLGIGELRELCDLVERCLQGAVSHSYVARQGARPVED